MKASVYFPTLETQVGQKINKYIYISEKKRHRRRNCQLSFVSDTEYIVTPFLLLSVRCSFVPVVLVSRSFGDDD